MPRIRLTPKLSRQIVAMVRSGSYDWLAAEAAGVPRAVFAEWLRRGQARAGVYRRFCAEVGQARAQARARAELEAHRLDPLAWLRNGPGRETADTPGWSVPVRPLATHEQAGVLGSLPILQLLGVLDEALRPYPAAREAVLRALDHLPHDNSHPDPTEIPPHGNSTSTVPGI